MPRKCIQDRQRRADILAKVPPSAARVQVITAKGQRKWRELDKLADSDDIQTKKNGDPIVMKGVPGRKSPINVGPANATVAAMLRRKQDAIADDPILKQMKKAPESPDLLQAIIVGLGEEQACIKFEREEAAREGKETSGLSSRRVQALRATADTWLKRMDQLTGTLIDLDSPVFAALFGHIMSTLQQSAMFARLRDEQIEMMFTRFSSMVDTEEWKNEARGEMKKAGG